MYTYTYYSKIAKKCNVAMMSIATRTAVCSFRRQLANAHTFALFTPSCLKCIWTHALNILS